MVKILLRYTSVDPSTLDNAIRLASDRGHSKVVELLLADERVDPTSCDNEAVELARTNDHTDVLEMLLADPRVKRSCDAKKRGEAFWNYYESL